MIQNELKSLSGEVAELSKRVGVRLRELRKGVPLEVSRKGRSNFVTNADLLANEMLIAGLTQILPGVPVLSEEKEGPRPSLDGQLWIVDPIDGTTNFVRGIPFSGISVAFCDGGRPIVGVVHSIFASETYTATQGGGTECNGLPVRVSQATKMEESIVSTGFPYPENRNAADLSAVVSVLLQSCGDIRRMGAASIDGCGVASGIFDAYYESVELWDVAAARLLVSEAGGKSGNVTVADEDKSVPEGLRSKFFLCAATEPLYRALSTLIGSVLSARQKGGVGSPSRA